MEWIFWSPGYSAVDGYDGNLTSKVEITKEEISSDRYNIVYSVTDSSNNKASVVRSVEIIDDIAPQIVLNGNSNISLYLNDKYNEQSAKATDNKDGDLTDSIQITGSVDTSKEGTYTLTYTVSDTSKNKSSVKRTVTVKNKLVASNSDESSDSIIYLTFDDGPSSNITPGILDILKEKNVKATFFLLNYDSNGEKYVKREFDEGHAIAIHGFSHSYSEIYASENAFMENITKLQDKLAGTIGYRPTIIRFPGGSSNTVSKSYSQGIMSRLTKRVIDEGYKYFDWNVSAEDAGSASTSSQVYANVTKGLRKGRANVVLMHDFSGNKKTLNALADIIDYGIENGYTFRKITESTPMIVHRVNN